MKKNKSHIYWRIFFVLVPCIVTLSFYLFTELDDVAIVFLSIGASLLIYGIVMYFVDFPDTAASHQKQIPKKTQQQKEQEDIINNAVLASTVVSISASCS